LLTKLITIAFSSVSNIAQPISALRRLVEHEKRNSPPPSPSKAPNLGDTNSVVHDNAVPTNAIAVILADIVDERDFEGLDWKRMPQLEQTARGGPPSWVYRYGWPVWHTEFKKSHWLCRYCHQHCISGAAYNV
jgi:hypothetical protein